MTDTPLFDIDGEPLPQDHAHTERGCYFCENRTATAAAMAGGQAAYGAADHNFIKAFQRELVALARSGAHFTATHVLVNVRMDGYDTREARSVGHLMKFAERAGIIRPTGDYMPSPDKTHHNAPKRVWVGTGIS